jgi:hypothetical protein
MSCRATLSGKGGANRCWWHKYLAQKLNCCKWRLWSHAALLGLWHGMLCRIGGRKNWWHLLPPYSSHCKVSTRIACEGAAALTMQADAVFFPLPGQWFRAPGQSLERLTADF